MRHHIQGKVALITGSTSGIGQAAAEALATEGVRVVVSGRDEIRGLAVVQGIVDSGGEAIFVQANLSDPASPAKLVAAAAAKWDRLDVIVNNAALVCNKPLEEVQNEDWDGLFQVNVKAAFFIIQAALPWLRTSKGSVINVSSINRMLNGRDNFVYDSMKAALNHMTRGLALDLRDSGIRVNAIMPGGTLTPLLKTWLTQLTNAEKAAEQFEQLKDNPFVADPRQIAELIVFLASDKASWINGAEIPIDGGKFLG